MDGMSGRREARASGHNDRHNLPAREGTRASRVTRKGVTVTVGTLRGRGQSFPPTWLRTASSPSDSRAPSEVLFSPSSPLSSWLSLSASSSRSLLSFVQLGALFPHPARWMSVSDGEPSLRKSTTSRNAAFSPLSSLSLTRDHITDALAKSPDGGATLDLAYKGLTDVGESGAEELSRVGEDEQTSTGSSVVR